MLTACAQTGPGGDASGGQATAGTGGGGALLEPSGGVGGEAGSGGVLIFAGQGLAVDATHAGIGFQGEFFMLEDVSLDGVVVDDGLMHTDLWAHPVGDETQAPVSQFSEETGAPCIAGILAQVTGQDGLPCETTKESDCQWDSIWGGGIELRIDPSADGAAAEWDATTLGARGFEFSVSGDLDGAKLRIAATDATHEEEEFCAAVPVGKGVRVDLSDLKHACWDPTEGRLLLDTRRLTRLKWQLVPDESRAHSIDRFCLLSLAIY